MEMAWRLRSDGRFRADVVGNDGLSIFYGDTWPTEQEALDEARRWMAWSEGVPTGRVETVYYLLAVPELWAGPPLGAHRYSGLQAKIGTAKNVLKRIQNLRTGTSSAMILHALEPGGVLVERARHQRFAAERRQGEWFACSPALMQHMFDVWQKNNLLPPEHRLAILTLQDKIDVLLEVRKALGGQPDMINPSLNEEWRGKVLIDFLPPNGMTPRSS